MVCMFNLIYGASAPVNLAGSLSAAQYGLSLSLVCVDDNRDGFQGSSSVHQRGFQEKEESDTLWERRALTK